MRMLRSIAFCALALCASAFAVMPSAAAVPIDHGLSAVVSVHEAYPAPVIMDTDHVAMTCDAPAVTASVSVRSSQPTRDFHFATIDGNTASFINLRRRC